jgi:phospholipid/cholesterol/gamma-HCH transport system ATP-binding protein
VLVENLHKSFGRNQVLRGVNLSIRRGEMVAIVGASGGGKSVLLKHLIGVLRPDVGRVCTADHESPGSPLVDLATLDEAGMDRLRRHWAIVFQKNALFSGTVFDNVALGLSDVKGMSDQQIRDRVRQVLESVGLGFDEVAPMDRDQVSGGMAKRVAIARALALDPVLMFYDEPTTGLDPGRSEQIQNLIAEVHGRPADDGERRTTIIVTHDTGLLFRLQPRIIMLHEGVVHFDGTAEAFQHSDSPAVRPYLELMPVLQARARS